MTDAKDNQFDENKSNATMDRFSRTVAELGVDTMRNLTQLAVLVVGMRGVGIETAKNLILSGPRAVHVWDEEKTEIADLNTNFYLKGSDVGKPRSTSVLRSLAELNPFVNVDAVQGAITESIVKQYGVVIVTTTQAKDKLVQINKWCRSNGVTFLLALNHGVTASFFSDFGPAHVITDPAGEPLINLVVERIDEFGVVTVADEKHGFDDGAYVSFSEVEGLDFLNTLDRVRIKRVFQKLPELDEKGVQKKDAKGNPRWRQVQAFNKFQLDFSDNKELKSWLDSSAVKDELEEGYTTLARTGDGKLCAVQVRPLGEYKRGGIVTEVRSKTKKSFRSLEDALTQPAFTELDVMMNTVQHMEQGRYGDQTGSQLHLAYQSLFEFASRHHGQLPRLHSYEDAKTLIAIGNELLAFNKQQPEGKALVLDKVNDDIFTKVSLYARTELPGLTAFLGGVAAQEVVKRFGKYTPVQQFLYVDYFELLTHGIKVPEDATPLGCRYDHQIAIFGKAAQDKIASQRWFLVGAGALGCEYLKGIALMGVGTGPGGVVHVTDMDRIEVSNLSRQFLFRQRHVGLPKSRCGAEAAKEMNPDLNLQVYETRVGADTENIFTDEFWSSLHGVWNALDNIPARLYTDAQCVLHGLPLLESGTEGTKCNSSIHIPHQSPSYGDGHVDTKEEGAIPMCTLKTFPFMVLHCIEWARPRFSELFEFGPRNVNTLLTDKPKFFAQIDAEKHAKTKADLLESVDNLLSKVQTRTFDQCLALAWEEFHVQYRSRILDLMYHFPENARETSKNEATGETVDMGPFWTGKKRFPQAADFDINNELHRSFLYNTANLYAVTMNLPSVKDEAEFVRKFQAAKLAVPTWTPPKGKGDIVLEEKKKDGQEQKITAEEGTEEDEAKIARLLGKFKSLDTAKIPTLTVHEFEKDDDCNHHVDYITAAANLRAWNYRIQPASRLKVKVTAGKIIAALATTTALVAGLVELEFYKIVFGFKKSKKRVGDKEEEINPFWNSNVNLGTSTFNLFNINDPARIKDSFDPIMQMDMKAVPNGFSKWDFITVDQGDLTVEELVKVFPEAHHGIKLVNAAKHGLAENEAGDFLFDMDDVYVKSKKEAHEQRLKTKVSELYKAKYSQPAGRKFVLLDVGAQDEEGNLVKVPVLKFVYAH